MGRILMYRRLLLATIGLLFYGGVTQAEIMLEVDIDPDQITVEGDGITIDLPDFSFDGDMTELHIVFTEHEHIRGRTPAIVTGQQIGGSSSIGTQLSGEYPDTGVLIPVDGYYSDEFGDSIPGGTFTFGLGVFTGHSERTIISGQVHVEAPPGTQTDGLDLLFHGVHWSFASPPPAGNFTNAELTISAGAFNPDRIRGTIEVGVPEPNTSVMVWAGLGVLAAGRRKRKV